MIAKVPSDVASQPSVHRGFDLRVFVFEDGGQLFASTDGLVGELFERLVKIDAFDGAVIRG